MPRHTWSLAPNELADIASAWTDREVGALLGWAIWAADGLHYLLDLDDCAFGVSDRLNFGYDQEAVDLAHVRWASASAITVLDLCAATLGRLRCPSRGNEYSLRDFDPSTARGEERRRQVEERIALLTEPEHGWVADVLDDEEYRTALRARNPMAHASLKRTVYAGTRPAGPHDYRTGFPVGPGGETIDSRPLIELSAAVATRHLESFLAIVKAESA